MTKQDWFRSEDPQAMLKFLSLDRSKPNERAFRELACVCCRFAVDKVSWGWTAEVEEVLQIIERCAHGELVDDSLIEARQRALKLSDQAFAHHNTMIGHGYFPSDYVWAIAAVADASLPDSFNAVRSAAGCAVSAAVGIPLCCLSNDSDRDREAQAKRDIADMIREKFQPFR